MSVRGSMYELSMKKGTLVISLDFELTDVASDDIQKKDILLSKDFCKKAASTVQNQEILLPFSCGSSYPCSFKTYPLVYHIDKKESYIQGTKLECDWSLIIKTQSHVTVHFALLF